MNNRFAIVIVALVIIFGGILITTKKKADAPTPNGGNSSQVSSNIKGEGVSGVTLVEYGDFECPGCTSYYPLLKQVYEKYKKDIKFQFVNFPLTSLHQHAMQAHKAAHAAGKQGKFWEMHDLLYENRNTWSQLPNVTSTFDGYASQIGLDMTKYRTDATSAATNAVIRADMKKGNDLKITGTPTFFLDGKRIDQAPQDLDGFSKIIDTAIANKKK